MKEKVILAYSGGLDTSIIISWLKENYDVDVIAACIDVGQKDDMEKIKAKALKSGASKVYIENLQEEFVTDYLFKGIKANALYEDEYYLGTSYARPLMSKDLVRIAHKEGAKYICHGCTGKGNDQIRFEMGFAAFDPTIKILAPWRIWDIKSREEAIDYANARGIEVPVTKEKIYSKDENMWHISHEGGDIEDPKNEHKREMYEMVTPPEDAKDEVSYVEIHFEKGIPTKIDGAELSPVEIIKTCNKIAGDNGIGIIDLIENRVVGMKSRGVYETPAGTLLYAAHEQLEHLTLDKATYHYKQLVDIKYGELVYEGYWFSKLRESLDAFIDTTQENVTGDVKMRLYKGNMTVASISSPYALYDENVASFAGAVDELYTHKDADGFIKVVSLPSKIEAMMNQKFGKSYK